MKKLVIVLLFTQIAAAQGGMFGKDPIINKENWNKQRVHWGYFLGFNSLDFKFDYLTVAEDIQVESTTGFNVGLVGNLRLTEYFDFEIVNSKNIDFVKQVLKVYLMFSTKEQQMHLKNKLNLLKN